MPKFKSDDRPSDTKSVVLNREHDARLLAYLAGQKNESAFWKLVGNFHLDFSAWLTTQPDAPAPGLPFIHYQAWLEQRPTPISQPPPPDTLLPEIRAVFEAALSTALAGLHVAGPAPLREEEFESLFSPDLVLE